MLETIIINDVSFGYNNELILNNINLIIYQGSFVGIVGSNGCGKSTLLQLIIGTFKPKKGKITFPNKLRIGYVKQTSSIEDGGFPASVFEIVSLGLRKKPFSFITKQEKKKVYQILKEYSLLGIANNSIQTLSGGQLQKVKIAKVMLANPDLIILDEPTVGIDEISEKFLQETLMKLKKQRKTIILVTHEIENLINCDVIYKIENKKIITLKKGDNNV